MISSSSPINRWAGVERAVQPLPKPEYTQKSPSSFGTAMPLILLNVLTIDSIDSFFSEKIKSVLVLTLLTTILVSNLISKFELPKRL
ncbi:hypothetical protein A2230_01220 [candidate division WOR-1 bacterium RIFOXYA2_FULL_36_21]|uniref:Uncharacterized protein n=1 Tax=candidate division WOR-1 bacterium RIFOXYB2_FULL_36_35 TaxID=1802578 RepID=A0A1F4RYR5_UNCSA|nr:MAG: hypothetical protein A2230_01220 [candidate division WOR-1 bacterium RIFOXYA2_FULL_36_21]OGC13335.1 MAG: hypothetical protein A2290_04710 [candidate division WOR-1 bacterium RIFOXYB2_FULL_36_35]OGC21042.1 MAG: hypothetical protein A2282_08475 [candidate division WOR-1 bacterium RIFOXYA12_FULL_36_13]